MKSVLAAVFLSLLLTSCYTTTPIVQERMVIAPSTITFAAPDTSKTVSITHTCTCPFYWNATTSDASKQWLVIGPNFPASMQGDRSSIAISIDRTKLTKLIDTTVVRIQSNSYGADSIVVIAIK
jgi:hypothetical protein